jgi:hypothetical protein
MVSYPYNDITSYPQPVVNLSSGSSTQIVSQNIQFGSVPSAIYIFAREQNSDLNWNKPDTFANISNVQITFDNKSNILSDATEQDLFLLGLKNGLNQSFVQWSKYQGSVLKVNPTVDFGLGNLAAGVQGSYNFSVRTTIKNVSNRTINYTLYIVAVQDGVLTLSNRSTVETIGDLTMGDVLSAPVDESNNYKLAKLDVMAGGSWLSSLFSKAKNFFKDVGSKLVRQGAAQAKNMALDVICKDYKGSGLVDTSHDLQGGMMKRMKRGGGFMSRTDLKNNVDNYEF